jgi:hypothetical protein
LFILKFSKNGFTFRYWSLALMIELMWMVSVVDVRISWPNKVNISYVVSLMWVTEWVNALLSYCGCLGSYYYCVVLPVRCVLLYSGCQGSHCYWVVSCVWGTCSWQGNSFENWNGLHSLWSIGWGPRKCWALSMSVCVCAHLGMYACVHGCACVPTVAGWWCKDLHFHLTTCSFTHLYSYWHCLAIRMCNPYM